MAKTLEQMAAELGYSKSDLFWDGDRIEAEIRAQFPESSAILDSNATAYDAQQAAANDAERRARDGNASRKDWQILVNTGRAHNEVNSNGYADSTYPVLNTSNPDAIYLDQIGIEEDAGKLNL